MKIGDAVLRGVLVLVVLGVIGCATGESSLMRGKMRPMEQPREAPRQAPSAR